MKTYSLAVTVTTAVARSNVNSIVVVLNCYYCTVRIPVVVKIKINCPK